MKRTVLIVLVVTLVIVSGIRVFAHHSQAAVYQGGKKVTIEGEVAQVLIRSPHSFVHVLARDEKGEMQRWAIEWGAGGRLGNQGVTRETLKPGDRVIITGNPGRNPDDRRLRMRTIERPADGWKWSGIVE